MTTELTVSPRGVPIGPLRATHQISLKSGRQSQPTSSQLALLTSHHVTLKHASPDITGDCGAVRIKASKAVLMRRTGSLDTIAAPYLTGQWPRDVLQFHSLCYVCDKYTQTPDKWDSESQKRPPTAGAVLPTSSSGISDETSSKFIRYMKAKSLREKRSSPVLVSKPLPVPSRPLLTRTSGSVEGLNQEIERLVLRAMPDISRTASVDSPLHLSLPPTPEGHRAPAPESRSVDTQTPNSPTTDVDDKENLSSPEFLKLSPRPNSGFLRTPPDGCERVKVFTEQEKITLCSPPVVKEHLLHSICQISSVPPKRFNIQPSVNSAFCPIPAAPVCFVSSQTSQT